MRLNSGVSSAAAGLLPTTLLSLTLRLASLLRGDVRDTAAINDDEAQRDFICWWLVHGRREYPEAAPIHPNEIDIAYQPVTLEQSDASVVLPRLAAYLWSRHDEIRSHFDLTKISDQSALLRWFDQSPFGRRATAALEGRVPGTPRKSGEKLFAGGVNLIGYALAELGIGEDLRMAAMSLECVGIPFCVVARQPLGRPLGHDRRVAKWLVEHLVYDTSILCMTGFDTAALALEAPHLLAARYVIGQWPWELPRWPEDWMPALDLVDEIWAASRYIEGAFSTARLKPVVYMPMASSVANATLHTRASFGLPDNCFLFLCCLDLNSYAARKNPMGAVTAFRRAFPRENNAVGLVVKAMGANADPATWERLLVAAKEDPRIRVLEGVWPRDLHLGLIHACDSVVSLHRSEGFGRVIAEAMLLRRPVIATGFSGSNELVTSDTALVVVWHAIPVEAGDYPYGNGQYWADPDLEHAARCLRLLSEQKTLRDQLAENAYQHVIAHHAPTTIGARYAAHLSKIWARNQPEDS